MYQVTENIGEWQDYSRRGSMAHNMRAEHAAMAEVRGSWGVGGTISECARSQGKCSICITIELQKMRMTAKDLGFSIGRWSKSKNRNPTMNIHLVDGTYELFRSFYGPPPKKAPDGREVGATIGLLRTLLFLINDSGATHIGCAFDHVIESFRNDLFDGYKTGEGIDPDLFSQFELAEQAVSALGIVVWPMVEFEADDAIATATVRFQNDPAVEQVVICSPDKDLAQLVIGNRVVSWDRRREIIYDEPAVIKKYGVSPVSIPDYLALVGDAADGIPGVPAWGAKSVSTVLSRYPHIEDIPEDTDDWGISAGRARRLAENLEANRDDALLYRRLTTLRTDVPLDEGLNDLEWLGAPESFKQFCQDIGAEKLLDTVPRWRG